MGSSVQADAKFLRRVLFGLVALTMITGALAEFTTVQAMTEKAGTCVSSASNAEAVARRNLSALTAPTLSDFEVLAEAAFAALPAEFRALCGDVVLRIEDFPTDEVVADLKAQSPFDLLGLFQGIGLAQDQAVPETGRLPNTVFLYRRPILDYWAENEETLGAIVTHVLVHEIGHHFGLSDADMEEIERKAG